MKNKFISVLTAFAAAVNIIPCTAFTAFAVEEHDNEVHVIVENTVFTPESENWDDSFWYGELVSTWVGIDADSTVMTCVIEALDKGGYTQEGAENSYITDINGLKAYDGGDMSGWMGTLNDWFTNEGFDAFTAANGKLEEGDEIRIMYTCAWGADLGSSWENSDTSLKDIKFSEGTVSPAFDKDTHEYTLNIPEDTDEILITPTACNKNYQVRTRIGDTIYKRTSYVPVENSTEIIVECNYEGSASMNSEGEPQTYTFNVKKESSESAEPQDVSEILNASLAKLAESVPEPNFGSTGGEWSVIDLARGGYYKKDDPYFSGYYEKIVEAVNETAASVNMDGALHKVKSTENSRLIIALAAVGKSAESVGNWNLIKPFEDFSWITAQGINGPVWALIALDTKNYQTKDETIRRQCIEYILSKQLEGGGWAFSGDNADPDMTGMAIQALSRYMNDADVKSAVDKAAERLSEMQTESGGFASWGSENSESISQVITALSSIGINPDTDERFIKNGNSAVDALLEFYAEQTNDFKHILSGEGNAIATDQAVYALISYDRLLKGKPSLYDMSDVDFDDYSETTAAEETTETTTTEETTESAASAEESAETTLPPETAESTETTLPSETEESAVTTTPSTDDANELPQTGNNSAKNFAACIFAAFLIFAGSYSVIKAAEISRKNKFTE